MEQSRIFGDAELPCNFTAVLNRTTLHVDGAQQALHARTHIARVMARVSHMRPYVRMISYESNSFQ